MKKLKKVFEEELIGGEHYSFEVVVWYWITYDGGTGYAPSSSEVEVVEVDIISLYADRDLVEGDYELVEEWVKDNFVQKFF